MKSAGPSLCLLWALLATAAWGQPPTDVLVQRDVEYGRAGDESLKLHLVLPKQKPARPLPWIVFVHGGAWRAGSRDGGIHMVLPYVASGQFLGASIGYRLTPAAIWPAQIHDCKGAIRFLRANSARYGGDGQKIGVWGSSAGGHLAGLLGTTGDVKELEGDVGTPGVSSRVQCVVDYCGPTDFVDAARFARAALPPPARADSPESVLLGGPILERLDVARAASPITYVSADDPPFLLVHGTEDLLVEYRQAEMMEAALKKAGVEATLVKIDGGGHAFGGPEVARRVDSFLKRHLLGDREAKVSAEPIPAAAATRPQPVRPPAKKAA